MTITLYGLKTCDSCRAARRWLEDNHVSYDYRDVRADGLDAATLAAFTRQADWRVLLNRRSTSWRGLSEAEQQVQTPQQACALILKHPTLLKRPVLVTKKELLVGFKAAEYARVLGHS